jgi:hypothetical protein
MHKALWLPSDGEEFIDHVDERSTWYTAKKIMEIQWGGFADRRKRTERKCEGGGCTLYYYLIIRYSSQISFAFRFDPSSDMV